MATADVTVRGKGIKCACGAVAEGDQSEHEQSVEHTTWLEQATSPDAVDSPLARILNEHPPLKEAVGYMDLDNEKLKKFSKAERPFMAAKLIRSYYFSKGWGEFGAPDGIPKNVGEFCKLADIPDIQNDREKKRQAERKEEGA